MSCPLRYRANSAIIPMSYRAYYDSSRLREMWLPLLSDSLPGSKQLPVGAFDELDSEAESKVAEESLIRPVRTTQKWNRLAPQQSRLSLNVLNRLQIASALRTKRAPFLP